ncbi:MAG: hypothetical protein Q4D79_15285 [Propionibacteriaceae bacterium]|nr:hypothetical protein [Propionibacteriaceae bacterium]
MLTPWQLVDPDVPLGNLTPSTLLLFTESAHQIVEIAQAEKDPELVAVTPRFPRKSFKGKSKYRAASTVQRCVDQVLGPGARVMLLPPLVRRSASRLRMLTAVLVGLPLAFIVLHFFQSWLLLVGVLLVLYVVVPAAVANPSVAKQSAEPRLLGQEKLGVTVNNLHAYALAVKHGELWQGALPAGAPVSPQLQVARIRDEYGRLRTDLIYRIENPALFDPSVPTTAAFEKALARFTEAADPQQLELRADRVELTFTLARQHAERVGLRHVVPEDRDDVQRAAKVARMARRAATPGERAAALKQLQKILDALTLYYLPRRVELAELMAEPNAPR